MLQGIYSTYRSEKSRLEKKGREPTAAASSLEQRERMGDVRYTLIHSKHFGSYTWVHSLRFRLYTLHDSLSFGLSNTHSTVSLLFVSAATPRQTINEATRRRSWQHESNLHRCRRYY